MLVVLLNYDNRTQRGTRGYGTASEKAVPPQTEEMQHPRSIAVEDCVLVVLFGIPDLGVLFGFLVMCVGFLVMCSNTHKKACTVERRLVATIIQRLGGTQHPTRRGGETRVAIDLWRSMFWNRGTWRK